MRTRHKGLRALAEQDRARRVLTLLDDGRHPGELATQPCYRLHPRLNEEERRLWPC